MSAPRWLGRLFAKPYDRIGPQAAADLVATGALLLDVREKHEYATGHAPQARHLPLSQLPRRAGELPADRTIVTVCRSGSRSAQAASVLASSGRRVTNLTGGMHAWARAGLPVVAKGGRPGRVV